MDRSGYRETEPATLNEALKRAAEEKLSASAARGAPEQDTIGDDLCRRLANIDNHLMFSNERLSSIASKLIGVMPDELNEKNFGETTTLSPPLIERLSSCIYSLERRANELERTIDRFSGLV